MAKCLSDCPLCEGLGVVPVLDDEGYTRYAICPNFPISYKNTGVVESDRDIPKLLERNNTVYSIGTALKALREQGYGMLWVQGGFGIGKTVLAKAATVEIVRQRKSALYIRQLELINNLRSAFAEDNGQLLVLRRKAEVTEKDWLVIDEIGRVNQTDFSDEMIGDIIDTRYQQALEQKSMTVLISNDKPENVLPPYLVDRIRDVKNKVLTLEGKSLRKEQDEIL